MAERYIRRSLEPALRKATAEFPAVVLTGSRKSARDGQANRKIAGSRNATTAAHAP